MRESSGFHCEGPHDQNCPREKKNVPSTILADGTVIDPVTILLCLVSSSQCQSWLDRHENKRFFILFKKKILKFIYSEREREREHKQGRGREKERQSQAGSAVHSLMRGLKSRTVRSWPELKLSRTLNWLSQPGALQWFLISVLKWIVLLGTQNEKKQTQQQISIFLNLWMLSWEVSIS